MAPPPGAKAAPSPSPSPSPSRQPSKVDKPKQQPLRQPGSYASEGVDDNDVFLLPVSDYKIMVVVTVVAALVRLFRIYQPTSVVFDEVQYVAPLPSPLLPSPPFPVSPSPAADVACPSFGGFASKYIKGRFFMDVHPAPC